MRMISGNLYAAEIASNTAIIVLLLLRRIIIIIVAILVVVGIYTGVIILYIYTIYAYTVYIVLNDCR